MKKGSGFAFRRFICWLLAACYGILALIATAPHMHDRMQTCQRPGECHSGASAAFVSTKTKPPADQVTSGSCRLCGWGRSTAGLCPVSTPCAPMVTADAARSDIGARFIDRVPAGNVLLRAPPAA